MFHVEQRDPLGKVKAAIIHAETARTRRALRRTLMRAEKGIRR